MGQQTSTTFRLSDVDPAEARMAGLDGGTPSAQDVTYGKDDYGTEFKVFGATAGCYMLWDESADTLKVTTTSAVTTGAIRSVEISQTMTAASTGNTPEALKVALTANIKTGAWANAIFAQIDYSTAGAAHGMAAAICAEIIVPNSSLARGALYALDLEIGAGASSSWASAGPVAFMRFGAWGTKTNIDDDAFLFVLDSVSSGSAHLWYDHQGNAPAQIEEWIRVKTPGGTRYLGLYDAVV